MSDSVCSILLIACLDVCTGICVDFTSIRHAFTENLCRCSCCCGSETDEDYEPAEREPLINGPKPPANGAGMPPQPPMQVKRP
ncbi:hypothetical protein B0H13DRAFT_2144163 [Mycena leptocephala]|nr:hypothetical protein B0H13DRAFT_2144163 [Mycena leptocephala]